MNEVLKRVALFVRDLLTYDEQLIRIGRQNFEQVDFETNYIVVDALGKSERSASLQDYDGDTEIMKLGGIWKGPVTLDFYGSGTYDRAIDLSLRSMSQAAIELRKNLGIAIYHPTGPTDVKQLTGQIYGERVQIEMMVEISQEVDIATLRIDTAQLEIRTEEGIQYDG